MEVRRTSYCLRLTRWWWGRQQQEEEERIFFSVVVCASPPEEKQRFFPFCTFGKAKWVCECASGEKKKKKVKGWVGLLFPPPPPPPPPPPLPLHILLLIRACARVCVCSPSSPAEVWPKIYYVYYKVDGDAKREAGKCFIFSVPTLPFPYNTLTKKKWVLYIFQKKKNLVWRVRITPFARSAWLTCSIGSVHTTIANPLSLLSPLLPSFRFPYLMFLPSLPNTYLIMPRTWRSEKWHFFLSLLPLPVITWEKEILARTSCERFRKHCSAWSFCACFVLSFALAALMVSSLPYT